MPETLAASHSPSPSPVDPGKHAPPQLRDNQTQGRLAQHGALDLLSRARSHGSRTSGPAAETMSSTTPNRNRHSQAGAPKRPATHQTRVASAAAMMAASVTAPNVIFPSRFDPRAKRAGRWRQ